VEYTKCIDFEYDIWLQTLTPDHQTTLFGAFAAVLRCRQFSRPDTTDLAASTVQETINKLGEIFKTTMGYNPTHVPGTESIHPALSRQFRGIKNSDPGEVQQKALPVCVYREMHKIAENTTSTDSDLDGAVADTLTLAFFFCMQSCKYADVEGEWWTTTLCIKNTRFYNEHNQDILKNILLLHTAVSVTLTFELQKRDKRNNIISHQRSNDKQGRGEMCPVKQQLQSSND